MWPSFLYAKTTLFDVLNSVSDFQIRRFLSLLTLGTIGPGFATLKQEFSAVGLMHILVLSGSQMQFVTRAFMPLASLLARLTRVWWLGKTALILVMLIYVSLAGWPAPLTRAWWMSSLGLLCHRWRREYVMMLSFVLHSLLFPEHFGTLSFVLSWLASTILGMALALGWSRLLTTLLTTTVVTLAVGDHGEVRTLFAALLANVALVPICEVLLMPLIGVFVVLAIVGIPSAWIEVVLGYGLEGAAKVVLFSLTTFRYILGV